jgi:hypothetical protein
VNNKKIHKKILEEVPSIEIPSVDEAWKKMQEKLDKKEKNRPVIGWKWFYLTAIFCLVTGFGWWLLEIHPFAFRSSSFKEAVRKKDSSALINKEKYTVSNKRSGTTQKERPQLNDTNSKLPVRSVTILSNKSDVRETHKNTKSVTQQKNRVKKLTAINIKSMQPLKPAFDYNDGLTNDSTSKKNFDSSKIQKGLVKKLNSDSSKKEESDDETKSEEEEKEDIIVQAGLQWTAQLPIFNSYKYFAGTNGFSQPYRLLLPGIWISLQSKKMLFSMEVNPFATSVLANKAYATKSTTIGSDIIVETRTLHKVFGTTAGFGFNYNIINKWWLGGRINGNFWRMGTGTLKGEKVNAPGTNTSVVYENNFILNDSSWADFSKFQLATGAQLLYKQFKWQAGIQFDYYIVPLIDKAGQKNQTGTRVFIRWSLYPGKKKN